MSGSDRRTILLVDDNQSVRTLLAGRLGFEGFHVLTADSVESALDVCKQYPDPLDLLIADIFLPRTVGFQLRSATAPRVSQPSGVSLAQQIRFKRPEARILYISGHPDHELKPLGVFKEPWPLLRKPFPPNLLVQSVQQVLDTQYPPWIH